MLLVFLALHLTSFTPEALADPAAQVTVAKAAASEQHEREVDQVALSAQDLAISRLMTLLKKYQGTSQEAVFLSKLADIQQQKGAILFRIAHGNANRSKKPLDLSKHHAEMKLSIKTLDRLISRFPSFEEIPHAYFLRGKAYEEIEKKADAGKNYLHLVQHFPNAEDSTMAYMSLADFAIEANDHARAITFLREVEKRPEDPHFPFALYKMAWSYYNLKKIPESLSYAERQIAFYNERKSRVETDFRTASDDALRENMLLDTAVFYFEGFEQKLAEYSVDHALGYFQKLEKGPALGKMLLRFGKLLRSHSHDTDLTSWKNQVLAAHSNFPESLDLVILVYDYHLNARHYDRVVECARDMVGLYAKHKTLETFPKAQKQLLDTADGLQALIIKNKGATEVGAYSKTLAQIYDSFVHIVEESDPRIPRVHYNLAETLFTIKDFEGATENYRWVVDHGTWGAKPVAIIGKDGKKTLDSGASVQDASLKAIASRYETLHKNGLIPKELKPRALSEKSSAEVPALLAQWIEWLDTHMKHSQEGTENFAFEGNRALYAQGQITSAVQRMAKFSQKHPKSTYAIPQASLVLDTYIASTDWEMTHETATEFMDVTEWKKGDFSKHLLAVASDAFYKQIEVKFRAREFKAALKQSDQFLKRYAASARLGDALALAGTAALEDIDRKRAEGYFSRLIKEVGASTHVPTALLSRAAIHEDRYEFAAAASDYHTYLKAKAADPKADRKEIEALRKKTLMLTWLSADASALKSALEDHKTLCTNSGKPGIDFDCEKYQALFLKITATASQDEKTTEEAFDKARHDSSGENRPLWAMLALEGAKNLTFRDRLVAARHAANGWEGLDPLIKFSLLPRLSKSLVVAFQLNRADMKDVAPLRANERYITRRVEVIREMENAATKVIKLPWARIRAGVLNELAGVYLDLSRGIAALPPPKGLSGGDMQAYEDTIRKLTMPFEEKGQDMRGKAFEIASKFAIEEEALAAIAEPFFAENPSQAKALKGADARKAPVGLELNILAKLDPKGGWSGILKDASDKEPVDTDLAFENPSLYLKTLWTHAVQARQPAQIAFFMQEAQEKALIQAGVMGSVKALSLAASGAQGEGLAELEEARNDLPQDEYNLVTKLLVEHYQHSYAREKAQSLLKEMKGPKSAEADKKLASH